MNRLKMFAAVFCFLLAFQANGDNRGKTDDRGKTLESAWEALVREDPSIVDDESISADERSLLEDLTPAEAQAYLGVGGLNAAANIRSGDPRNLDLGGSNVATGMGALGSLTTGAHNTAMGYDALGTLTTGVFNTAIGRSSLRYSNGFRNTAIGQTAMRDHTSGGNNTAVGDNALRRSVTGSSNTAVGTQALRENLGQSNTGVGASALRNATTGFGNIALGRRAGHAIITGSSNIMIGNEGTAADVGVIRIGNEADHNSAFVAGVFGVTPSGPTETVIIDSDGELGTRPATTSTVVPCPGGPSPVTCSCPEGVVSGGGGICAPGHVLDASFPSAASSWEVSCVPGTPGPPPPPPPSFAAPGPPGVASAFAVCIP